MKNSIYFAVVAAAVAAGMSGCRNKSVEPGRSLDLSSSETVAGTIVERDTVADVAFTFGDKKVSTTEVARVFDTDSSEIYLSLRVYALKEFPAINNVIAHRIDSVYTELTMDTVSVGEVSSVPELSDLFDTIGRNFTDSVAPQYYSAIVPAFNIAMDFRPVYAYKDYLTYSTYIAYFLGGAHADYDFYYTTFDPVTAAVLGFDDLIDESGRAEVRKALVETIARSDNKSVDEYLASLNGYLMSDDSNRVTVDNFPIVHVGIGQQGLVFCYPKYSIAPGSEGCPTYVLPIEGVKKFLSI